MKTVPLLYFKSVDMAQRNVEGIANYISEALTRAGYHVPHIYWGHPDFEKDTQKGNSGNGNRICIRVGSIFSKCDGRWLCHLEPPEVPQYTILRLPRQLNHLRTKADRSGGHEGSGGGAFRIGTHQYMRAKPCFTGSRRPMGSAPEPCRCHSALRRNWNKVSPWRNRPFEVSFCGNLLGMELRQLPDGSKLEEIFSDFKDGPAPFPTIDRGSRGNSSPTQGRRDHPTHGASVHLGERPCRQNTSVVLVGVVNSYVKRHRRLDVVKQFVKSKRKLHLFGMGWEWLAAENRNVVLHGSGSSQKQDEVFDQSKILLHINAQGGANDRVFWATAKGAALLAQRNPTVDVALVDGVGYLGYDRPAPTSLKSSTD